MKKLLILPSTTGQGDLAVAQAVANRLVNNFDIATVCFHQNMDSPIWREIDGERVLFSEASHPYHSKCLVSQLRSLSGQIAAHSPDLIIALNEASYGIAAVLANRPVVQLTHFADAPSIRSGRKVLNSAIRLQALSRFVKCNGLTSVLRSGSKIQLFDLLQRMHSLAPFPLMVSAIRRLNTVISGKRSRLQAELIQHYGRLLGMNYLSQLLCDSLILHSVFPFASETLQQLNDDRKNIGKDPVIVTHSLPSQPSLAGRSGKGAGAKTVLLTFGGIDHPVTDGFRRLMRLLNNALQRMNANKLRLIVTGRVTERKRPFFESTFSDNPFFKQGGITLAGSIDHSEHLRLMGEADLVITQPGYSTLCELLAVGKPFMVFYGLAAYYEQYANFVSANQAGLSINADGKPWLQIGEYNRFSTGRAIPEKGLLSNLSGVLTQLVDGKLFKWLKSEPATPTIYFCDAVAAQARHLTTILQTHWLNGR